MAGSRIKGITVVIGGDTTKLTDALKKVNSSIKQTQDQLKDVNKLLKLDPGNTDLLSQKQKYLKQAITDTKEKLKEEKAALEQLKSGPQTEQTVKQQEALTREIEETTQKLKALTKEYKNFASVAGAKLQEVGSKMQTVGGKIADVGGTITKSVTLPLAAAGAAGVKNFADVDKTMQLANKTMGNSADQARLVGDAMKSAAANSTYGMSDAANAVLNFARAGLDAQQSASTLAPAMNLAAGEGGNLDTVSAGLVATINGFHGSFDEAGNYADIFASACNNSALDVDSLSNAMSVAAPIFSSAGYKVNDAALYMGIMANNGIDADKAANSLKTGIARLVSPAKEGAEAMASLGIEVTNSDGSMKDSVTIQRELHDAFGRLSESEQIAAASAIFGKNQMAPWLALINTAPSDVDQLNTSLANCSGTTKEMADTMMGGFGGSIEKLKSSIDVLTYSLGESLAPYIQKVIDGIQGVVDKFNALDPKTRDLVVKIGLIVAAVGPVLAIVGKTIVGIGSVVKAVGILTSAIGAGSAAATAAGGAATAAGAAVGAASIPILPIIGIIAAVVAAIVVVIEVIKHWGEISQWFQGIWSTVCQGVQTIGQGLGTFFSGLWTGIQTATTTAWNAISTGVTSVWTSMTANVGTFFTGMQTTISTAWTNVQTATSTAWDAIQQSITEHGGGIKGVLSAAMDGYKSLWQAGFEKLNSLTNGKMSDILSSVRTKMESVRNAFKEKMDGAHRAVSDAISRIKGAFNFSWHLPHLELPHLSVSGYFSLDPPSVPDFSISWYRKAMDDAYILNSPTIFGMAGGRLLGGGEAGEEAVVGTGKLSQIVQQAVASVAGAGADQNIIIPVYIGQDRIDEIVVKANQRTKFRSGGR